MYDAIGSGNLTEEGLTHLKEAGVHIHPFKSLKLDSPTYGIKMWKDFFYRTHRKLIVIDHITYSGGMNFSTGKKTFKRANQSVYE